jgi:hypothetical protein
MGSQPSECPSSASKDNSAYHNLEYTKAEGDKPFPKRNFFLYFFDNDLGHPPQPLLLELLYGGFVLGAVSGHVPLQTTD